MSSPERSPERLRHHYEVEKELAARLRNSSRGERAALFKTLYNELFERVADHPRLTRRDTEEASRKNIENQMRLLGPHLLPETILLEFAPGDCRLSFAASEKCQKVIGVDISDQRAENDQSPVNFELIVYDGYELDLPADSVDVAFSYQFLEHLHPDDVDTHFQIVHRLLKPGGVYVFDTPHRFSGPHDISRYFGEGLDCFHFQEWTFREMRHRLEEIGFKRCSTYRRGKVYSSKAFQLIHEITETLVGMLPKPWRQRLAARTFQSVTLCACK